MAWAAISWVCLECNKRAPDYNFPILNSSAALAYRPPGWISLHFSGFSTLDFCNATCLSAWLVRYMKDQPDSPNSVLTKEGK